MLPFPLNPGTLPRMADPRWFQRHPAATLLLVNALFLVLVEVALRLTLGNELLEPASPFVVPDSLTHHDYKPGVTFTTLAYGADRFPPAVNQINRLGLRGPEPGPKQGRRVLLVGDSFVQADEVAYEETFGALLNQRFAGRVEFIAHGMASWAPTTEFSWIHHRGLALQPDEVVLFLCANDFFRAAAFHEGDQVYRGQAVYDGEVPVSYRLTKPSLVERTAHRVALARLAWRGIRLAVARLTASQATAKVTIPGELTLLASPAEAWPTELHRNVDHTMDVVVALKQYLTRRGIGLRACLIPLGFSWPDEVRAGKQHPLYGWTADHVVLQAGIERYLRQRCLAAGIPWLDLQAAFERAKTTDPTLLFNPLEGHWTPAGHRVVADALTEAFALPAQ